MNIETGQSEEEAEPERRVKLKEAGGRVAQEPETKHAAVEPLLSTSGRPITERAIQRGMRINVLAGSSGMIWAAVALGMPLTMLLDSMKASGVLIGLATTVQQLSMLVQVPAALVSEWLSTRKPFWFVTAFLHRVIWLVVPFLPYAMAGRPETMASALVIVVALSSILAQASAATWWSWITDLVPDRLRNRFWSVRQGIVFTAYLVAMGVAGYALDLFPTPGRPGGTFLGFAIIFGAAAVLGCADIIIHMGVPEPRPTVLRHRHNILQRIVAPLRHHDFRALTLAMGFWSLSVGLVGPFGMLFLKREFGISYTGISATVISSTLGVILASMMWGYVMDRLGARNFAVIMLLLAPLCGVAWFVVNPSVVTVPLPFLPGWKVSQALLVLTGSSFLAGALYSGVGLAQVSLIGSVVPREGRTMAMAVHFSVIGLMAAGGPILGGMVVDHIPEWGWNWRMPTGTRYGFIHALVTLHAATAWILAAPVMARIRRRAGEVAFRTALSRFLIVNPFRMLGNITSIHAMGVAETRHDRADAIRRLGEGRTEIAVSDLIEELEAPSLDVREEAAIALGRIACPEAVEALVRKLADADVDMVPEIARALRPTRDGRVVEALIRRLGLENERAAVIEIVRTLGEQGDRRADEPILALLRTTSDSKIMIACSEALVRLGCFAAVYQILPRMKAAGKSGLRQALTVNVGDLLGQPGGFYRVFSREQRSPGSETERMLSDVSRAMLNVAGKRWLRQEADEAARQVAALDEAYLQGRTSDCVRLIHDIAIRVAHLDYGIVYPGEMDSFVEAAMMQDERFAVGLWFVGMLLDDLVTPTKTDPDKTDVLLGIHFLAAWARRHQ